MPLIPLYGHESLRERLIGQISRGTLPSSLLLHGPAGVGKQRLALWLAQSILCEDQNRPCGECQHCRMSGELQHPDIRWVFPRPRIPNSADIEVEQVKEFYDEEVSDLRAANGLYSRPDGSSALYIYVTRLLAHLASRSPALAKRKVFIVGDAERMAPQASSQEGANAFLKLLEEPPADTVLILTSSEPGSLLPTIRSRVVAVRVPPLNDIAMAAFVADPLVAKHIPNEPTRELIRMSAGSPGTLISSNDREGIVKKARLFLDAADKGGEHIHKAALAAGIAGARGAFSDVLDVLTVLLHDRVRDAAARGDEHLARRAARSIPIVESAKAAADGNVNPQLLTASLLTEISKDVA